MTPYPEARRKNRDTDVVVLKCRTELHVSGIATSMSCFLNRDNRVVLSEYATIMSCFQCRVFRPRQHMRHAYRVLVIGATYRRFVARLLRHVCDVHSALFGKTRNSVRRAVCHSKPRNIRFGMVTHFSDFRRFPRLYRISVAHWRMSQYDRVTRRFPYIGSTSKNR